MENPGPLPQTATVAKAVLLERSTSQQTQQKSELAILPAGKRNNVQKRLKK